MALREEDLTRHSEFICGKLRSNFLGTQFTIYEAEKGKPDTPRNRKPKTEIGAVLYEHNFMGTRGPRKMTILLPKEHPSSEANIIRRYRLFCEIKRSNIPLAIKTMPISIHIFVF